MDERESSAGSGRLVGRERELAELRAARAAVRRGRSRCVHVVGEPGIGKSRLLAELGAVARREAWLVLAGRGTEFEVDVPFGIFVEALDDHVAALGAESVRRLSGDRLDELAAVLPALAGAATGAGPHLGDERHRLHYAVRALLNGLADARPLLVALDDVHWADAASLELVGHLVRRPSLAPLLLVLAFRSAQAPAALTRMLDLAARDGAAARVALGPLSRQDADALLAGRVPASRRGELYELSGGNPLFLDAFARTASRPGAASVPEAVRVALGDELDALTPAALTLARGAAVVGEPFAPELAATAAELAEREALDALDELVSAELVAATDATRQFRFRHPVVREAVYTDAGHGWRLAAHARAAAALARQGASVARRAHHLELCAQPGDRAAVDVLAAAARAAAARAPSAAAHWWAAALRLLPSTAPPEERLALLAPMATALGAAGDLAASRDALREVLALLPADQPARGGQIVAFIALIEQLLGQQDEAHALLSDALAAQPDSGSPAATALRIELANERFFVGDWAEMRRHAADALDAARALADPVLVISATGILALAEHHRPDTARAQALLDEAATRLDALSDDQLAVRLDAALFTGWGELCIERWDAVHRHLSRATAVARATGQGYLLVPMTTARAIAYTWQGALGTAAELADEAIDASRLAANDQSLLWSLTVRCWVATLAGDLVEAIRLGEEALGTARRVTRTVWAALAGCFLAEARLEAGDPDGCRAQLLDAAGGRGLPLIERAFQPRWFEILTRAELARGRLEEAERWAAAAEAAARAVGVRGRTSEALRARAAVRLARGDSAAAAEAARDAARAAHHAGNRLDEARAHLLAGVAEAAGGNTRAATIALRAAESSFAACGARRFRDQAARELRRLGRRVARQGRRRPARPRTGPGALTDREREIAELVRAGQTNSSIAAQLHLSAKTVETHLSHIFAKLQVRSRAAVAATIARPPDGT
jgi:DNA-binding NarL/FixJ family response regulator